MQAYIVFNLELEIQKRVLGLEEAKKTQSQLQVIFNEHFTIELEQDPWAVTFYR